MVAAKAPEHHFPITHRTLIGWTFLFRALNLADAALEAARQERGETLALIARSMLELAFHINAMKNNPAYMDAYGDISDSKRLGKLKKCRSWLASDQSSDPSIIAEYEAVCHELEAQCGSAQNMSISDLAKHAQMEKEYYQKYEVLCRDTHHNAWALTLYLQKTGAGLEVQNHYPDDVQALYLSVCLTYWSGCLDILWQWCEVQPDPEYQKLMTDALEALKGKAASG
jgi:hypothetical protein